MRRLLESGMMLVPLPELEGAVMVADIEVGIMLVDLADEGMRGIMVLQGIRGHTHREMFLLQRIADRGLLRLDELLPLLVATIGTGDRLLA